MKRDLMKYLALALTLTLIVGCESTQSNARVTSIPTEEWSLRQTTIPGQDSLVSGSTYLSSYSQVYVRSKSYLFSLTGTISIRNTSLQDTIYVERAIYYGTGGKELRNYFEKPIFLAPMETIEIIISEEDVEGGTGDNFVFDWYKSPGVSDPFFEGVFISVHGQQGISFTTQGIPLK